MNNRRLVGRQGEDLAVDYLQRKGYRIVERNARTRYGEIDIVAELKGCLVFVEVRTVHAGDIAPEESIGRIKQRRMGALAMRYVQARGSLDADWRIDVVAIELERDGRVRRLTHIPNAVEQA